MVCFDAINLEILKSLITLIFWCLIKKSIKPSVKIEFFMDYQILSLFETDLEYITKTPSTLTL